MRILLLCHFPLAGSGSGTYTRNIASHLIQKGHEVCLVLPENTSRLGAPEGASCYPVYFSDSVGGESIEGALPFNFPCFTTHPRSMQTFYDLSDWQVNMYISAFEAATARAIREFEPDLIHVQHIWLLAWVAMNTGLPYIITSHGTDLIGYKKTGRFRAYADEAARNATRIITISRDNDELVKELFPESAENVVLMKNGYDTSRFYPGGVSREEVFSRLGIPATPYMAFFAGKLTHFKGVDVLLEAAKLYEGEHRGAISTLIAGDGELFESLRAQARRLRLENTHFLGFLHVYQLRELYSIADVTIVPSRREPFGLVAIEALACASPVVATNQGGLPDIICGEVGSLVRVDDPFALSGAITCEIFNEKRLEKGQKAARYALENYSQASLIDQLIREYNAARSVPV